MRRHGTFVLLYALVLCARCDYLLSLTNEDEGGASETLQRDGRSTKAYSKDSVEIPAQPFVNAPPAGPMETLSIDIKGDSATYKNFTKTNKDTGEEDLFKPSKVVSRSLEKEVHDHGYLRNAIAAEETTTTEANTADDDDSSGESGDDENDDKEIKAEDIVEKEVPKKKKKNLNALVKPINTKNTNAAAVVPAAPVPAIPNPFGAASVAPPAAFAPPAVYAVAAPAPPSIAAAAPVVPPAAPSAEANPSSATKKKKPKKNKKKRKKKKKKKRKKRKKKLNKGKYKVYNEQSLSSNTTNNTNTSNLPKWAQNLKEWSQDVTDGIDSKSKPKFEKITTPELKKGPKGVTMVSLGGGETELPPLTPPAINPLLNDSGELDPHKEKTPPLGVVDDDADDEGELPSKEGTVKVDAAVVPPPLTPPPPAVAEGPPQHDHLKATHPGDEDIDHDTPQESLKEGHEQGPLPPGHEQGPKLPGHEKGPLLPGQSHAGNITALQDAEEEDETTPEGPVPPPDAPGPNNGPSAIEEAMAGGHCSPCLGEHGLGVPVMVDQDGSLHCQPCHGAGSHVPGVGPGPPAVSTLKEQYLHDKWGAPPHGAPPSDTHEPFQLLLPADPSGPPPSPEQLPFNPLPHPPTPLVDETPAPPVTPVPPPFESMSITHDEFEKMGHHMNPELLSVIEKNNHKISALWNEVKDVQSRVGNIESVMQVVEKAVQRIESKLESEEPSAPGVFVDDPVHQKTLKIKLPSGSSLGHAPPDLPLYPPRIGEYHDPSRPTITEGFPHTSHHSPVLKQYFIPLQPVDGGKDLRPSMNGNGLPYSVNKFLTFLMGELQKERNPIASPAEIAMQLQNLPLPARVPHVPLPQPDLPYPPKEHDIDRLEYEIGRLPKKFSPKVLHPEMDDQPAMCPCENGGECIQGRSDCDCPIRYTGIRCEKPVPRSPLLDQIINDLPTETQNQIRGGAHGGMITLPLVIAAGKEVDEPEQKLIAEANGSKVVNLLSQFFTPEYLQKFAKRHKVNVRRRYVKYPHKK